MSTAPPLFHRQQPVRMLKNYAAGCHHDGRTVVVEGTIGKVLGPLGPARAYVVEFPTETIRRTLVLLVTASDISPLIQP